ncbi:MAG: DotI/IcmL/TraM family protein [Rhodospirillales bacterium]|nr:DotI/IcmL/TraM family protein [Rhodospirillales bacterium]MCB9996365.1 DotI/IcmL/TraM family protein [Rhodospirillales bacterium]
MRTLGLLLLLVVLIVAMSFTATIVTRNNGIPDILRILYPERFINHEDQTALETGKAPFADAENNARPVELHPDIQYDPLGDSIVISEMLDMPHRNEGAISEWVTEKIGKVMTFTLAGYQTHIGDIQDYMNAEAIQEFQGFLDKTQILALMQQRNFEVRTFVADVPRLATSGVAQDRYRWVYDIPVNITFLPVGKDDYEKLSADEFISETLTIRIQIGRVPEGGDDGIEIETWEALKKKAAE